ncbi:MAG: response regulator [Lachnospiraceae bacterium]
MSKRIVICDDAELIKTVLKDILTKAGYEIVGIGSNGEEACSLYREQQPDLLIVDINMPTMDGVETLAEVKKMDKNASVVICSSSRNPKVVMDLLKAGASDFIIKPFQPRRVLEVVNSIIGMP